MSFSVAIHPPKTPITAGSGGEAKATLPNVCKMPGPPAPFIPSPLPNIAKSGNSPDGYSTSVKIEGEGVAIRGATFQSMGDEASKGTGGGLISANTQGIAKFIPPGTMDVKIEGKNVHLKGDQVLNNCASGGSPPNTGATMMGTSNPTVTVSNPDHDMKCAIQECDKKDASGGNYPMSACTVLGTLKHTCVEEKLNAKGYKPETTFDMRPKSPKSLGVRVQLPKGAGRRPDLVVPNPPNSNVYDAKFPCSKSVKNGTAKPTSMGSDMTRSGSSMMSTRQEAAYQRIAKKGKVKALSPKDCAKESCP